MTKEHMRRDALFRWIFPVFDSTYLYDRLSHLLARRITSFILLRSFRLEISHGVDYIFAVSTGKHRSH